MEHSGICAHCGKAYLRNRPLRGTTCSHLCAAALYRAKPDVTRLCKHCGTPFSRRSSSKVQFCSIACFNRSPFRGTNNEVPMLRACERCGTIFKRYAGHINQRFCSKQCTKGINHRDRKETQTRICARSTCGQEFTVPPWRKKRYCSSSCGTLDRNKHNKEFRLAADIWPNARLAKSSLLKEFGGCQECGYNKIREVLELHHLDRNRRNNHKRNLSILCPTCHSVEHFRTKTGQFTNNLGRKKSLPK